MFGEKVKMFRITLYKITKINIVIICIIFLFSISVFSQDDSSKKSKESPKKEQVEVKKSNEVKKDLKTPSLDNEETKEKLSKTKTSSVQLYTSYNIWFENPDIISSVNYKKGTIIPAGTKVKDIRLFDNRIYFKTIDPERTFNLYFYEKYHPEMSVKQFKERLFTPKSFEELTQGLSETEIHNIKEGVLKSNMSKQAVIVCYGYPPEHKTFSTKNKQWVYWISRFRTQKITFDEKDRTKNIQEETDK